uniref:Odorant receptor n=1 Tax=Rhodnius prolixus TaxID=13249 RepID=T1H7Z1_RHOPR
MDQDQHIYDTAKRELWYFGQIGGTFINLQPKWKIYSILQLVIYLIILVYHVGLLGKTVILSLENHDIATIAMSVHIFTLGIVIIMILINMSNHRENVSIFLKNINTEWYNYGDSTTTILQQELNLKNKKFKIKLLVALPSFLTVICLAWIVVVPIVDQYQGGKKTYENGIYMECPVPLWFPYLIDNNFKYLLSVASEASDECKFIFCVTIAAADVAMIFFLLDLITQLKILNHSIKSMEKRARILYEENGGNFKENALNTDKENAAYSKAINYCIQQNVEHHKVIMESFDALLTITKWPLMLVFLVAALVIALSLYISISYNNLLFRKSLSIMILFGEICNVFILCWLGQQISDQSNSLFYQFYNKNWFHWDKSCKTSLLIARERYKKPMVMSGGGLIASDINTFSD